MNQWQYWPYNDDGVETTLCLAKMLMPYIYATMMLISGCQFFMGWTQTWSQRTIDARGGVIVFSSKCHLMDNAPVL